MTALAELPGAVAVATWEVFVLASPYILLGLAAAGLLHGLLPAARVAGWLGRPGLGSMARGALLGIPLPLCSCAVVPVTLELSRKGASREASLAFLVSTPETGVDSMLLTWGLMGPVMTVARPVAALATSLVAAISSRLSRPEPAAAPPVAPAEADGSPEPPRPGLRRGLRYGFRSMVDEIGFWLVVGLLLTGLITALVPAELIRDGIGQGPFALVAMLLLGVPLYMCASASTPIAAALMFKGLSPGAALVFLLAGPATNASSLVLIARFFGRRFLAIYLGSVAATALAAGLALDLLVARAGWSLLPRLATGEDPESRAVGLVSAAALLLLLAASFARGSWRAALREVASDLRQWRRLLGGGEAAGGDTGGETHCAARLPYRGRRHAHRVPGEPALALRRVSCRYPGERRLALEGIDLDAAAGARLAIVGPNGAGKSTLLKVIAGLLPAVSGEIRLYGQPEAAFHHRVAYLPQRGDLDWGFPISLERLVLTGRYVHLGWLQRPSAEDQAIVRRVLAHLRLEELADRQVGQLSGGQQQRALLGRALAQEADLLLLDEPLNAVDASTRRVMAELLDELRRDGTTVLVATHDIGRRDIEFDDALYLNEGRIVAPPAAAAGARG